MADLAGRTLVGKTLVLGVGGGIAAYKAAELCRLFVKQGANVHAILTPAAESFIGALTLQTLSGNQVGRQLLDLTSESEIGHIKLADRADLIVVAPATADLIARFAAGLADDLLTAVVLASRAPVLLAPAMNTNMWQNPLTQANLERLLRTGRFTTVGPDAGPLACGWVGPGRLVEPEVVLDACVGRLGAGPLVGKRVMVTAGPTHEPVDEVRFLGNRSSGKMGFAMAHAAAELGAEVTLIAGPVTLATPSGIAARVDVTTAIEMQAAVVEALPRADVVVMAAAVADFRPARVTAGKLSRRSWEGPMSLPLVVNPDILADLGRIRRAGRPLLVGFAAEIAGSREALESRARAKLAEKGCDVLVANEIGGREGALGRDENQVVLVFADGRVVDLPRAPKVELARAIWTALSTRLLTREQEPTA